MQACSSLSAAHFADPHIDLNPEMASMPMLMPLGMSFFKAKELLLTRETIPVEATWEEGLLNHVVGYNDLNRTVNDLPKQIPKQAASRDGCNQRPHRGKPRQDAQRRHRL